MRETSGGAVFARHARGAALLAVAMMLVAPAAMAARSDREAAAEPAARTAPVVRNTVDELKQLMDARQLTELRTTYNGNYGASLLFNANTLTYYVALFQEKNFWRVIKTDAVDNAERVYRTFAQQSEQLAQVYIDTTRLEAGKRYTERLVAYNEERLRTLQQEMEQQQAQQQAVSLSTDVQSTNSQLDALQRRIQILQAEQGNPELSLPKPESVPSPAPAAASDGR